MKRVEIVCSKCDSHLGHEFEGENYNKGTKFPNKRHCVNSISIDFKPKK